jgi:hypothetical protein
VRVLISALFTFIQFGRNGIPSFYVLRWFGGNIVIGKQYFVRQAATLLKFAKSTKNPDLAAVLVEKAADLKSKIDESQARWMLNARPDFLSK